MTDLLAWLLTNETYWQFVIALHDKGCLASIIISLLSICVERILNAKSSLIARKHRSYSSSVRVLSHATCYVFDGAQLSEINVDCTKDWFTPPQRRARNFLIIDVNHDYRMNNRWSSYKRRFLGLMAKESMMSPTTLITTFVNVMLTHYPVKTQRLCMPEMPFVQQEWKLHHSLKNHVSCWQIDSIVDKLILPVKLRSLGSVERLRPFFVTCFNHRIYIYSLAFTFQ